MATRNRREVIAARDEEAAAYSGMRELIPELADHPATALALLTREQLAAVERYELALENRRRIDRTADEAPAPPAPAGDEW